MGDAVYIVLISIQTFFSNFNKLIVNKGAVIMAGSVNKVILVGNVGKDPEIRSTQDGREIASLTLATSESWRDKSSGERREKTEWHRVSIFSEGLVNIVKNYVKKGSKLYIEGSLQTRKWTDASGTEKYTTEVVLQGFGATLTMLDSRGGSESAEHGGFSESENPSNNFKQNFAEAELEDEIPF